MPYLVEWIIPERVILVRIEGQIQQEEIALINQTSHDFILLGQAPIHYIVDVARAANQPFNFSNLSQWSTIIPKDKVGWGIIISPGKMVMFTIMIIARAFNIHVKKADSVEEAMQILNKVDPTLLLESQLLDI